MDSRNHPVAFHDLQAMFGPSMSPGYGPRRSWGTFSGTLLGVGYVEENQALAVWSQGQSGARGSSFMEHVLYRVEKIREGDTNTQLAIGKRAWCLF